MNPVFLYTLVSLGGVSFLLGIALAFASRQFAVVVDPHVTKILDILPGVNCGGCGYAGCTAYAEAIVREEASANLCAPGGPQTVHEISQLLGIEGADIVRRVAFLHCAGSRDKAKDKYIYDGIKDCRIAVLLGDGQKACEYGCLGFGTCCEVCNFDALHMDDNGLPVVDREKCTGCGACVRTCPRNLFTLEHYTTTIYLACSSHNRGKAVKEVCSVGCIGCSICVKVTEGSAVTMEDNLPSIDYDVSPNLIIAHYKCPTHSYTDLAVKRPYMNIDSNTCKGHGKCKEVCPVKECVTGETGEVHSIEPKKCIGCGKCIEVCPEKAIRVVGALGYVNMEIS